MASMQCIQCDKDISKRQQSLQCTGCARWQHRTCGTGVSQDAYRQALREDKSVVWTCSTCSVADAANSLDNLTLDQPSKDAPRKKRMAKFPRSKTTAPPPVNQSTSTTSHPTTPAPSRPAPYPGFEAFTADRQELDSLVLPPVTLPAPVEEDDLGHHIVQPDASIVPDPEFQIIDESSQRGKPKLIDNLGYSYHQTRVGKKVTAWRCVVRNAKVICGATVQQKGDIFTRGPQPHNHAGNPSAASTARIQKEVKQHATEGLFDPSLNIVEAAILKETREHGLRPNLPKPQNLTRMANYTREKMRPEEPTDLDFIYNEDFIPGFKVADLTVNGKRHLMFATPQQLQFLSKAKVWYLDGTFKVVRPPFYQLWSIHAFVANGEDMKQMPFLFVLMSSRRTVDYKAVFDSLKTIIDGDLAVQQMVLDFELSLWKAIQETFPNVTMRGCAFHWTQCVWRKLQGVGLQSHYMQDIAVHRLCKQLLGLPFIPSEHIHPVFEKLQERALTPSLQELMDYVSVTWMESSIWTPAAWSVFGQTVRTNNDVEGWHHRLNSKAKKGNLPFYMLVQLLFVEAELINYNLNLISEHRLKRLQRSKYRKLQADIFDAWDKYTDGKITISDLLDTCAGLYTPTQ